MVQRLKSVLVVLCTSFPAAAFAQPPGGGSSAPFLEAPFLTAMAIAGIGAWFSRRKP